MRNVRICRLVVQLDVVRGVIYFGYEKVHVLRLHVHLDVVRGVEYFGKAAHGSVTRYPVRQADRKTEFYDKNMRIGTLVVHLDVVRGVIYFG